MTSTSIQSIVESSVSLSAVIRRVMELIGRSGPIDRQLGDIIQDGDMIVYETQDGSTWEEPAVSFIGMTFGPEMAFDTVVRVYKP